MSARSRGSCSPPSPCPVPQPSQGPDCQCHLGGQSVVVALAMPQASRAEGGAVLSTPGSAIPATLRQHHLPHRLLTETNEPPVPATTFTPHCRGERGSARGPSAWGQPRDTPLHSRMGPPHAWHHLILPAQAPPAWQHSAVGPAAGPHCGAPLSCQPAAQRDLPAPLCGAQDGWPQQGHVCWGPADTTLHPDSFPRHSPPWGHPPGPSGHTAVPAGHPSDHRRVARVRWHMAVMVGMSCHVGLGKLPRNEACWRLG